MAEFSPDGAFVVTGSDDHTARVWDVHAGIPVGVRMQATGAVRYVKFSPDGRLIATGAVTTSGFTPSTANQIASGLITTTFDDTTALCGTTYYYVADAIDPAGASPASLQASAATGACPITSSIQINCGGPASEPIHRR
jgi:hypothetical protein